MGIDKAGIFMVIESFTIRRRKEFYLIGTLKEGTVKEDWFANIQLNSTLAMSIRISTIEEVEMNRDATKYLLLICTYEEDFLDILMAMDIRNETVNITVDGED